MALATIDFSQLREYCRGAVDFHVIDDQLVPDRLDAERRLLLGEEVKRRAMDPAGIRLSFETDADFIEIELSPAIGFKPMESYGQWTFDWVVDGKLVKRQSCPVGDATLRLEGHHGRKRVEFYLFQVGPVGIRSVRYTQGSFMAPSYGVGESWLFYGSSITQCGGAAGPSETWPAIVARHFGVEHWNLGFGGFCKLEPSLARMIRSMDMDAVHLALGINIQGTGDYSYNTFIGNTIGLIQTIRDENPDIPIVCSSPIFSTSREGDQKPPALSLIELRSRMNEAIDKLQSLGDGKLYYVDGLMLLGENDAHLLEDGLHPSATGYQLIANRFIDRFAPLMGQSITKGAYATLPL